jgi:hypothetical protein
VRSPPVPALFSGLPSSFDVSPQAKAALLARNAALAA